MSRTTIVKTALKSMATAFVLALLAAPALAGPAPVPLERALQSPSGQGHNTTSWARVAVTPPAGATSHWLELDYFVSSEVNYDFFKISRSVDGVNWTLLVSFSGTRSGRVRFTLPSGPCHVKLEYVKDGSLSLLLDRVAVDHVTFGTEGGPYRRFFFDGAAGTIPAGWSRGGAGGGFGVAVPLAVRSAGPGPKPAGITHMEKIFIFPQVTDNFCVADYFVDSRAGQHFLKAYFDGAEVASVSGRNKSGSLRMAPPGGGPRKLRFAYVKNAAPPQGLDTVRIRNVICSSGKLFERHTFSGQIPGEAPAGWTVSGFAVQKASPHESWIPRLPAGAPEPVANGLALAWSEYKHATRLALVKQNTPTADPTHASLIASADGRRLYLALAARPETIAQGNESGQVTLYVDTNRIATLRHETCPGQGDAFGPGDHRISFNYQVPAGGTVATINNIVQMKGDCTNGWTPLGSGDAAIGLTAGGEEPAGGETMSLEVMLDFGTLAPSDLGLGFVRRVGGVVAERFPYRDDVLQVPVDGDAFSLETVRFGTYVKTAPAQNEFGFDGCCFAGK